MKIFFDTADIDEIRQGVATGLVRGVTTNPTHVMNNGGIFEDIIREICAIVPEHVSAEAVAERAGDLVEEAKRISAIDPKVVVKIPMTREGLIAVKELEPLGIRTNVTMIFSATQAYLAMCAGASYVSIVLSRLEKAGQEVDRFIEDTMRIKHNYGFASNVLAGSIKSQPTFLLCLRQGVDVATIPASLFNELYDHPLTDSGLDQFNRDWQRVRTEVMV